MLFKAIALIAAAATGVVASHGDVTYYNVGLGACGHTNHDSEMVAAVGHHLYDSKHPCGKHINVHYKGKTVNVKVVDRCGGCNDQSLDLSPTAFKKLVGSLGPGRVKADWEFA